LFKNTPDAEFHYEILDINEGLSTLHRESASERIQRSSKRFMIRVTTCPRSVCKHQVSLIKLASTLRQLDTSKANLKGC